MRAIPRLLTALMLFGAASACAANKNQDPRLRPRPTYVEVENQAWLDVNLYVLDGAARVRLGTVGSTRTTTLRIPDALVGPGRLLRFQADPIGSSRVATSFEINVSQGETVKLTIPPTVGR